MKHNHQLK